MGVDDPSKLAKVDDPQAPQMKWRPRQPQLVALIPNPKPLIPLVANNDTVRIMMAVFWKHPHGIL